MITASEHGSLKQAVNNLNASVSTEVGAFNAQNFFTNLMQVLNLILPLVTKFIPVVPVVAKDEPIQTT